MSYSIRGRRPLPPQTDIAPSQGKRQARGSGHGGHGDSSKRARTDHGSGHNATSILYLGNVPKDWNEQIIESVVKGSGNIVDIRTRIDPSGRSKNYVFVEYQTPEQASRAMGLISAITFGNRRFKVELSKEGFNAGVALREPIPLSRAYLPQYVNLPPEMLAEDNINNNNNNNFNQAPMMPPQPPQPPQFQRNGPPPFPQQQQPPAFPAPQVKNEIAIPDILANASQTLPTFNASAFTTTDKISQNLSTINPPALIQMLSLLKSSDEASRNMALSANPEYTVNVAQALILMGVIDKETLQSVLQQNEPQQPQYQSQPPQQQQPPPPPQQKFNNAPRFSAQRNNQPQKPPQPAMDPRWAKFSPSTRELLSNMSAEQAQYMVQVLSMSDAEINGMPAEHKAAIMQIRATYL
ncbi:hypothetical protein WICPIJ_001685 [Wickerhamomyces pijperi]|uniref:RRM domain-containing protein n=1 Tax=Wickerhamomyces pijperi TaxID=599730 RepID=A0A9P8QB88_WICPI|nr:hypothetical protein WICPIJ_001685 [Wickerhamomyces pijperi]